MSKVYYSLNDLKIGMIVSVKSISKILNVRILLDKKTFVYDEDEIGFGKIVYIGSNEDDININDVIVICNRVDESNEEYSIDE